ncbi:MAG: acetyltransferase, partial [Cyanobacteria bacterium P01_A01_bin.83]
QGKTMLLKSKQNDSLVEISDIIELIDPSKQKVTGQIQSGEEEQDPPPFDKKELVFPSDENLTQCWVNSDYNLE